MDRVTDATFWMPKAASAVARAAAEAQAGETVLLAPAAASFDQYPNFEKRGEDFTARVKALIGG